MWQHTHTCTTRLLQLLRPGPRRLGCMQVRLGCINTHPHPPVSFCHSPLSPNPEIRSNSRLPKTANSHRTVDIAGGGWGQGAPVRGRRRTEHQAAISPANHPSGEKRVTTVVDECKHAAQLALPSPWTGIGG